MIVAYHHVIPEDDGMIAFLQPGMYVTTSTFERHIEYLSERYNIIPLERIHDLNIKNACIITFDDGWADNYRHAFPILARKNVPATVFVSTNYVGSLCWPWPDKISFYTVHAHHESLRDMVITVAKEAAGEGISLEVNRILSHGDRRIAAEELITYLKRIPHERLSCMIDEIDRLMHLQSKGLLERKPWVTWNEIREMKEHGISFGAHTHNHVILTNCTPGEAEREIITSREILSEQLGDPVHAFSYPNGDYHRAHVDILKRNGFTHAVTTRSGCIKGSADSLSLRRFMLHNDMTRSIPMLACKLTGRIPYF